MTSEHRSGSLDSTVSLVAEGYAWLPNRFRRTSGSPVQARILGQRVVAIRGPEAVRFFYDEENVRRATAAPEFVKGTLFGKGSVHALDTDAHRVRKAMFLGMLTGPAAIASLAGQITAAWDGAVPEWALRRRIVLFDEAAEVFARGVCAWAGVPLQEADAAPLARDLVALIDGWGTLGARHWQARRARGRREKWLTRLVDDARAGGITVGPGSALDTVAWHRDATGELLGSNVAAVELLNVIRPAVAISTFVAYAAHALHRWPAHRDRLAAGDTAFAEAFGHEVRRFYPLTPFVGARAIRELSWQGERIPIGSLVLLDVYGQHHDPELWPAPYRFDPGRFLTRPPRRDELIPQGGGDPATGHRCPGEDITIALLRAASIRLAQLSYDLPPQDLTISLARLPARPASGVVLTNVRMPAPQAVPARARQEKASDPVLDD